MHEHPSGVNSDLTYSTNDEDEHESKEELNAEALQGSDVSSQASDAEFPGCALRSERL